MKLNIYVVRDSKVEFGTILSIMKSDDLAIHSFGCSFVKSDPVIGRFEDYELYCVGIFDTSTGHIEPCEPRYITQGLSARELALSRLRKIGLESEVLDNGNGNMATETES